MDEQGVAAIEKCENTQKSLEAYRDEINMEAREALSLDLTDDQKQRIKAKVDALNVTFESWLNTIQPSTSNLDAYITSGQSSLTNFKEFIAHIISEKTPGVAKRSKRIKVIECIPVANKKIRSRGDIEKVLASIREKLESELNENDEIDLD